ncbi:gluconate 2-dehydrogenase subunit 3 family protein [Pseudonocardia alni]|uniref:gluconate 2-dehydrogenase subunit 3 family protein n=1 Tax=Pseudonocardia alni TaxID=33907 RepID=UPI00340889EA
MTPNPPPSPAAGPLDDRRRRTLAAAAERIHPADDLGPGAVDLGVVGYLEAMLVETRDERPWAGIYLAGLDLLDELARARAGLPFAELPAPEQDLILAGLDRGPAADRVGAPPPTVGEDFLDLLIEHVHEGVLGDPVHGGNRGGRGWSLLSYPGPRPVIPAAGQEIGFTAPTDPSSTYDHPLFAGAHR